MRPEIKIGLLCLLGLSAPGRAGAGEPAGLGAATCSSSGCHGGAGDKSNQFGVWSQRDVHSKSYATLTTSRSARMAEALAIADPASSPRCVVCHAPLGGAEPAGTAAGADPTEGVSCVSCHDLPTNWLRGHTRGDWTHAERVAAGMRDLDDLYTRANACVACHQNIDPALVSIGRHPALIFELDGQTQDEPKHWLERGQSVGPQAWFVGQAVALREVSWALLSGRADPARSIPDWQGLVWLLARSGLDFGTAPLDPRAQGAQAALASTLETADQLARRAAQKWDPQSAGVALRRLAGTHDDFLAADAAQPAQACRAERLVLSLDRLLAAVPAARRPPRSSDSLNRLFHLAQSKPDFAPAEFARELAEFEKTLGEKG